MGVQGLLSYIQNTIDTENSTVSCHVHVNITPGSTLCIDASGFMFWILDKEENKESRLRRVLGGSYSYYDQIIRQEIKLLRDEAKLNLVFYFDGRAQHKFKDLTLEKRLNEREQSIMTFLQACQRNQLDNLHARHLPLPPMMNAQLRSTLQGMGVEIVQCDSEADQEIAIRCNQNDRTYCYGKDTDFLILRGCRYIPFNSLYVGSSGAVALHLYTRDVLADAVGLSETQLVEWCLLIGNDYTGAYSRTQFLLPNMSTQNQSRVENLEQLRLHIIEQGEGYRVTARDSCPELQEAIEFSRALYELEDLSHYNIITASTIGKVSGDNSDSNSTNDDVALERLTEVGRLSQIHKSSIDIFLENEDVRHQVIDSHKQRQQLQIIKSNSSESDDEVVSLVALFALLFLLSHKDHFSHITESHIASIGTMLETVCKPPTHTITQSDKDALAIKSYVSAPIKSYPQIDVVYAAHYFQEICKYIGKTLRGNESLVTIIPGLMKEEPRHMFDVELFASLMNAHVSDTSRIVQSAAPQTVPIVTPIKSVVDSILHGTSDKKNKKQSSGLNLLQSVLKCPVNSITSSISDRSPQASESSFTGNDDDKIKELKKIDTHQTSVTSVEFKVVEDILPIDQHRDEILNTIETHRVTVIHGETGCGKSSRLPVMIMDKLSKQDQPVKMFVSQPRRLAVHGLLNRLRPTLGMKVGMRMGHGARDDSGETRICLVTTGYLVQLLANTPDYLLPYTHLIVDEVHERSVESDILCWLCKQALKKFAHLKLVLMSATIVMGLYQEYFKEFDPNIPCVFVGARRFPVHLMFADDIVKNSGAYSSLIRKMASDIVEGTRKADASSSISDTVVKRQYSLVSALIRDVVPRNTAVLVFVKGIGDIIEIFTLFENDPKYILCPVHSDIPIEEQMNIFTPITDNKVKIIVATNSAESSLTLPDVDVVICLGTQKALQYDDKHHIVKLTTCWISKASAIQRAGRTGRVRSGKVYRLYSEELHRKLPDHEIAEIKRRSMEEVILQLRSMLESNVDFNGLIPVLQSLIEPPDLNNVNSSFYNLFRMQMIESPDDYGQITNIGKIASALPIDLIFARLIIYGIILGVGAEAIVVAGALTVGSSLFEVPSPIYHTDPDVYNDVVQRVFLGSSELDSGLYSEPLMCLRIFVKATSMPNIGKRNNWAYKYGIRRNQLKSFISNTHNLCHRVNELLRTRGQKSNMSFSLDKLKDPIRSPEILNRLRLILAWVGQDNIVTLEKSKKTEWHDIGKYSFDKVPSISVLESQLHDLFPKQMNLDPIIISRKKIQYDCIWLRKYIVPPSAEQLYDCVASLQFAEDFITFSVTNELPVTWIVSERLLSRKQVADVSVVIDKEFMDDVDSGNFEKWWGIYNESELNTMSTLLLYIIRSHIGIHEKKFAVTDNQGNIIVEKAYIILHIPNATTSLQRVLTQLREVLKQSVSVTIQLQGHAKILTIDMEIDEEDLIYLFHLREVHSSTATGMNIHPSISSIDSMSKRAAKKASKAPKKEAKSNTVIDNSGLLSKQVLSETHYLQLKVDEETALNQSTDHQMAEIAPFSRAGFMNDVPLGPRLLNAYRAGYRDKLMRMKSLGTESAATKVSQNNSNKGNQFDKKGGSAVESILNQKSTELPKRTRWNQEGGEEVGEDGKYEFHVHDLPKFPTWKHITITYGSQQGSVKTSVVLVKSFGFSAVSCHMNVSHFMDPNEDLLDKYMAAEVDDDDNDNDKDKVALGANYRHSKKLIKIATESESVFGCVQNAMFVNQSQVKCENMSLFPLGCRWMVLAYLCIGRDVEQDRNMLRINYSQALQEVKSAKKGLNRSDGNVVNDDDDNNDNDDDDDVIDAEDLYSDESLGEPMQMYLTYVNGETKYKVSDYPVDTDDRIKCRDVDECMRHFIEKSLQPREELIKLVDEVFIAWYDDTLDMYTNELDGDNNDDDDGEGEGGDEDVTNAVDKKQANTDIEAECLLRGVLNLNLDNSNATSNGNLSTTATAATASKSTAMVTESPPRQSRSQSTDDSTSDDTNMTLNPAKLDIMSDLRGMLGIPMTANSNKKAATTVSKEEKKLRKAEKKEAKRKRKEEKKANAAKANSVQTTPARSILKRIQPPAAIDSAVGSANIISNTANEAGISMNIVSAYPPKEISIPSARVVIDNLSPPIDSWMMTEQASVRLNPDEQKVDTTQATTSILIVSPAQFIHSASQFKSPPYTCPLCKVYFEKNGWLKCSNHTGKCFANLSLQKLELKKFLQSIEWKPLPWDCCWNESQAVNAVAMNGEKVNPFAVGNERETLPLAPVCSICHACVGSRGGLYIHLIQYHNQSFPAAHTQFCTEYPVAQWSCTLCLYEYYFQTELADHLESCHHLIPHQIYGLLQQSAWKDVDV